MHKYTCPALLLALSIMLASCSQTQKITAHQSSPPYHKVYYKNRIVYTNQNRPDVKLNLDENGLYNLRETEKPELIQPLPAVQKQNACPKTLTACKDNFHFNPFLLSKTPDISTLYKTKSKDHVKSENYFSDDETAGFIGFIFAVIAIIMLLIPALWAGIVGYLLAINAIWLCLNGLDAYDHRIFAILGLILAGIYFIAGLVVFLSYFS